MRWFIFMMALAGCVTTTDVGCSVYGARRAEMPRPVRDDAIGRWIAVIDAAMSGACR